PVMPLDRRPARASLGVDGEMFGVGSAYGFKRETQIERSIAEINFVQRSVVVRTLTQQAHLADLLGGAPAAALIQDLAPGYPFVARFSLSDTTARALASSFSRVVVAKFTFGATTNSIQLVAEQVDGSTSTWADKSAACTWTLPLDITLA